MNVQPRFSRGTVPSTRRPRLARDVTQALGQVPMVRLNRVSPLCDSHEMYLKLESCNPGGSIKEKNAAFLVAQAEADGSLRPGGTIVESSSGNFGIGLAMVGAARGYLVKIVIDAKTSPTMRRMLETYGADLVEVPLSCADAQGSMQVARMEKAQELASTIPGAWYPCQHLNPNNPDVHALHTAREIVEAFGGPPDAVVVGLSTAGQIAGIARYFRERYPRTRIVGVDVAGSAILGTPRHPYKMTGLGLCFVPPNFDATALTAGYSVTDQLAFSMCHAIARREGLMLGGSTGAIVAAGLAFAADQEAGQRIALINPDRGDRYIETIYNPQWLVSQNVSILTGDSLSDQVARLRPVLVGRDANETRRRATTAAWVPGSLVDWAQNRSAATAVPMETRA